MAAATSKNPVDVTTPWHARRVAALQAAVAEKSLINEQQPLLLLLDVDWLRATTSHVRCDAGYPATALHTVAVKANPVGGVLRHFLNQGFGAEVASLGELQQALHVGFPPDHIVFDSPAKTISELRLAVRAGVRVNVDNFQELERLAAVLEAHPEAARDPARIYGVRINPQPTDWEIGAGSIAALSTAVPHSKFGVPLEEARQQLLDAFQQYPWLNALHLHVGSQGCPLELAIEGAARVYQLLRDINAAAGGPPRVRVLDIGGGLPVDYSKDPDDTRVGALPLLAPTFPGPASGPSSAWPRKSDTSTQAAAGTAAAGRAINGASATRGSNCTGGVAPGVRPTVFQQHAAMLRKRLPDLFAEACPVQLVTENGRSLLAQSAFAASLVE